MWKKLNGLSSWCQSFFSSRSDFLKVIFLTSFFIFVINFCTGMFNPEKEVRMSGPGRQLTFPFVERRKVRLSDVKQYFPGWVGCTHKLLDEGDPNVVYLDADCYLDIPAFVDKIDVSYPSKWFKKIILHNYFLFLVKPSIFIVKIHSKMSKTKPEWNQTQMK